MSVSTLTLPRLSCFVCREPRLSRSTRASGRPFADCGARSLCATTSSCARSRPSTWGSAAGGAFSRSSSSTDPLAPTSQSAVTHLCFFLCVCVCDAAGNVVCTVFSSRNDFSETYCFLCFWVGPALTRLAWSFVRVVCRSVSIPPFPRVRLACYLLLRRPRHASERRAETGSWSTRERDEIKKELLSFSFADYTVFMQELPTDLLFIMRYARKE